MRKILVWGRFSPLEGVTEAERIQSIGLNSGNLLFRYGVDRMLTADEDVQIDSTHSMPFMDMIDQFNAEYACLIIPLANAFRPEYMDNLRLLTRFVKGLKIPCVVVGVGIQAAYEPEKDFLSGCAQVVREFVAAVLEKSAVVGLRGQITADYLKRLGFHEDKDYQVIGCPSMYAHGEAVLLRDGTLPISPDAKVCFNMDACTEGFYNRFIRRGANCFHDGVFIPQNPRELELMRTGKPFHVDAEKDYPERLTDEIYLHGGARFFLSVQSWIDYLRTRDLCFGTRMHGNIASVLAGTPTLFLPHDARTRELVEYHGFSHLTPEQVRQDVEWMDWLARIDFTEVQRRHPENFRRYVAFLEKNQIRYIYRDPKSGSAFEGHADASECPPLTPVTCGGTEEIVRQLDAAQEELWRLRQEEKKLQLGREFKKLGRKVGRKVRAAVKKG